MRILSSNSLLFRRRYLALLLPVLAAGCAKFPDNPVGNNTRLIITMRVAGRIRNGTAPGDGGVPYHYFVAFNPSQDLFPTTTGPEPVIAPPWGNGFVAGGVTHYVYYNLSQAAPYTVNKFISQDLHDFVTTGIPITYTDPGQTGDTISFEIDLSQITPTGIDPSTLQSVQINFLTETNPPYQQPANKVWDALGDSTLPSEINEYVRIPLNISRTYTNADYQNVEVTGDTPDPDLDIVDWSVEVRRP